MSNDDQAHKNTQELKEFERELQNLANRIEMAVLGENFTTIPRASSIVTQIRIQATNLKMLSNDIRNDHKNDFKIMKGR